MRNSLKFGYTLIELAVSIVIIGLLLGAVAGGTLLISQTELRSLIAQMNQYKADYNAFQLQFNAIPGDMKDSSVYFTGCASGGIGNGNCDGNGDTYITFNMGNAFNGANLGDEPVKFMRHLNLAGINAQGGANILPSTYAANASLGSTVYFPKAKWSGAALVVSSVDASSTGGSTMASGTIAQQSTGPTALISNFPINSTVVFALRADSTSVFNGAMSAANALNLDRKVDDGDVSSGAALGANTGSVRVINDLTAANACVTTNTYNVTVNQSTCVVQMLIK